MTGSTMKTKLLLVLRLSVCFLGEQTAIGQPVPASPPNADPDRLRAIVQAAAQKARTKAVEFGMWVRDREILTMALGQSMTTVPATTDMHYRIGGIAETFMSTLLLMLVEQGHISLDDKISRWLPQLLAADQVTVRMLVANTAGYIDYVRVDDFLKLELAEPYLYRRRADQLLGPRRQDELPARHQPAILPHRQRHPGPGHSARYQIVDEGALRQEYLWTDGHEAHAVSGRSGNPEPGAARLHDGSQVLGGLHLLEPALGLDAGVAHVKHSRSGQMGPDPRNRPFDFTGALPGADRSDLGGQRQEQARSLFCLWICRRQWLDRAKPQHQRLRMPLRVSHRPGADPPWMKPRATRLPMDLQPTD
jgi:beta-lactamase family protein